MKDGIYSESLFLIIKDGCVADTATNSTEAMRIWEKDQKEQSIVLITFSKENGSVESIYNYLRKAK